MTASSQTMEPPWQPEEMFRRADVALAGDGGRVLKRGRHGAVVRLDGMGPGGADVIVKYRRSRDTWHQIVDRCRESPARGQERVAAALLERGIEAPEVLATDDAGWPRRACRVATRVVDDAESLLGAAQRLDEAAREIVARELGRFVGRLHQSDVYVPDLKHENLLVRGAGTRDVRFVLVDLDRARQVPRGLSRRRRIRNLVQLHWRLSWESSPHERRIFLASYGSALGLAANETQELGRAVDRGRRLKQRRLLRRRRYRGAMPAERPGVSAMIICQNEARRIRPCLESLTWCDEIVVVDGGSTDGTLDICREYTDRVISNPWPGHRAQKQFALDQTTQPWVLNVDSDERVPAPLREEIQWMLAHDGAGVDGFQVPRLVRYLGRWWWRGGWYPSRRLRLFRREKTKWGGIDPHEKAVVDGPVAKLAEPLYHLSYENVTHHIRSMDRLTDVSSRADPKEAKAERLYLRPPARFLRSFLVGRGFVEGFPGFFIAMASALYVHVKYVKADEEHRLRESDP